MENSIRPLTVLCDIDNTILNTEQLIVDEYNRRYNKSITLDNVTCWNYFSGKVDDDFFEFLTKPRTWNDVQPIEPICRLVRTMVAQPDYFTVYLVTATNPLKTGLREKLTVASKATGVDKHHIITCNDKHLLIGDIMIDDYTKNIDDTLCPECWLIDRPWNKSYKGWIDTYRIEHFTGKDGRENWCSGYAERYIKEHSPKYIIPSKTIHRIVI